MLTNEEAYAQASHRWSHDPEFHARVALAVRAVEDDLYRRTGNRLDPSDRSLAILAACLGVIAAEQPITNNIIGAMAQADHMPWLIPMLRPELGRLGAEDE